MLSDVNVKYFSCQIFILQNIQHVVRRQQEDCPVFICGGGKTPTRKNSFPPHEKKAVWLRETNIVHPCTSPQIAV